LRQSARAAKARHEFQLTSSIAAAVTTRLLDRGYSVVAAVLSSSIPSIDF